MITSHTADGLILFGSLFTTVLRASLDAGVPLPFPMVLAEGSLFGIDCPRVKIDNVNSGKMALHHLIETGRK